MSRIRANKITNQLADGSPTVEKGLIISGVTTVTTLDLNGDLDVDGHLNADNVSIAGVVTATTFYGSGANLTGIDATKIITGNTQVQTIDTGSDGHVKITTEGSERLSIDNTGWMGAGQTSRDHAGQVAAFKNTSNTNSWLSVNVNNNTGIGGVVFGDSDTWAPAYIQYNHSSNIMQFIGNGSERLRITSDGKILIGTTTHQTNPNADDLVVSTSGHSGITIRSGTSSNGNIFFADGTSGGDEYRGVIDYNHSSNHMSFSTNAVERLRIDSGGGLQLRTSTATASKLTVYGANDAAAIFQGSSTGTGAGNGLLVGNNGGTTGLLWNYENGPVKIAAQNAERVRIETDGSCYFGPQIITEADLGWGHDAHQRPYIFSGNQAGVNPADATIVVANPNTDPPSTRLGSFMFGCKSSSAGNSGIKAYIEGWTTSNPSNTYEAGGYIKFVTRQSGGSLSEHFKIDHDGKLYKSGNQFYPLVNYVEVATFSAASVSSNSYTDLRTIYSSYAPKKAGNLIVIHHQSQLWQGGHANGNGDAMWRLLRDEGSGFSEIVKNERIMGNMDGRNYTGNSGLARHHRTVHLMGSFTCNGNNFTLKTQGKVDHTGVSLQWYHNSENILQIWEYEKG